LSDVQMDTVQFPTSHSQRLNFVYPNSFFIYKWHARNFNVSFLAYDVTIQYGRGEF